MPRVAICVRGHTCPSFVLDTVDAIFHYSTSLPTVLVASDNNHAIAELVQRHYPQVKVYTSETKWGWGIGLYGLLSETIDFIESYTNYDCLLSVDYDAMPIKDGADIEILGNLNQNTGILGTIDRKPHWSLMIKKYEKKLGDLGIKIPEDVDTQKSVLGSIMVLPRGVIQRLRSEGFLCAKNCDLRDIIPIADDKFMSLLVQVKGYELTSLGDSVCNVWGKPVDYEVISAADSFYWIHPVKGTAGGVRDRFIPEELKCRNYFRGKRGRKPLLVDQLIL